MVIDFCQSNKESGRPKGRPPFPFFSILFHPFLSFLFNLDYPVFFRYPDPQDPVRSLSFNSVSTTWNPDLEVYFWASPEFLPQIVFLVVLPGLCLNLDISGIPGDLEV